MRLLVLSPNHISKWNFGHQLFRNELYKHADVVYHGAGFVHNSDTDIEKIIDEIGPFDAVISWSNKYCGHYESTRNLKIPVVVVIPDYFPHAIKVENAFINKHHPDLVIVRSTLSVKLFKENQKKGLIPENISVKVLHYGYCPSIFKPRNFSRDIDICASMHETSWAYKNRPTIKEACKSLNGYYVFTDNVYRFDYAETLSRSKIFVNSVSKDHVISPRYTEVMASGCMLMTDWSHDDSDFGLKHGENCIIYDGVDDMKSKVDYFLRHHKKRNRIAVAGYRYVAGNYRNSIQVKKVLNFITELLTDTVE